MSAPCRPRGETLLVDADDTLWENNVFFERVIGVFSERLSVLGHPPEKTRRTLQAVERIRTRTHGYGVRNFHAALREVVGRLVSPDRHLDEFGAIDKLCVELSREAPPVIAGVSETLRELAGRHRLILFTKGDPEDQVRKLHRAHLRRYFHQVDVVWEKNVAAYLDGIVRHGLDPRRSWMVGNSPRSDVIPALAAGLGAVFIPHAVTWALEQCDLPAEADRLVVLERFEQLTGRF